jgi:hypothetical protein
VTTFIAIPLESESSPRFSILYPILDIQLHHLDRFKRAPTNSQRLAEIFSPLINITTNTWPLSNDDSIVMEWMIRAGKNHPDDCFPYRPL